MNYIKHVLSCSVFTLALISNTFFSELYGQYLEVSDAAIVHEELERSCIKVLMEPGTKTVKDHISDWMKDKHDVRLKGFGFLANSDVLTAEEVRIPDISIKQMDFYVRVVENGDYSELCVFGSFGYNIHITPENYPAEYDEIKRLVFNFIDDFLPLWYQNQIDEREDVIADLEKAKIIRRRDVTGTLLKKARRIYPVYDLDYRKNLITVLKWMDSIENFFSIGRPGLFNYNNTDHCIDTGMKMADTIIAGGKMEDWIHVRKSFNEYSIID